MNVRRIFVGLVILLVVLLLAGVSSWFVSLAKQAQRTKQELDANGAVAVVGEGSSAFANEYRTASDLVAGGRIVEAENLYQTLAQKEPGSPNPYVGLASCRMERGDFAGARQLYQKALEMEPKSLNAFVGLGSCSEAESDYTNAVRHYQAALALNEVSPEAHWGLALAYAHLGEKAQARAHLDRFKKLAPGSKHIGRLEELVGHPARAR
jgi:Flp pilus assembly protein TadD